MTPPTDFGTCPTCGKTGAEFYPETIEVIRGYAGINLHVDRDLYTAQFDGSTDLDWDSSTTTAYVCGSCKMLLPERHALYLDQLLGIERRPG